MFGFISNSRAKPKLEFISVFTVDAPQYFFVWGFFHKLQMYIMLFQNYVKKPLYSYHNLLPRNQT